MGGGYIMKVTFDFSKNQIGIEGEGPELISVLQVVRDIAPKIPEIKISTQAPSASGDEKPPREALGNNQTLRQFARSLVVDNISEKIATIGYFLKRHEGRDTFSPKELADLFVTCGFQKPAEMSVALNDAKRKYGYVDNAGVGKWKLTTSGENVIIAKLEKKENGD
jgi:hypothetical protein